MYEANHHHLTAVPSDHKDKAPILPALKHEVHTLQADEESF
jgi:hypothetical protein